MEKNFILIHLVAPFTSYPNTGTNINKIKKKRDKIFNNLLKSFFEIRVIKNKIKKEIIKKKKCFKNKPIEYSEPTREYIANKPKKLSIKGITKSFFGNLYQLEPIKLWSSLKRRSFIF